MSKYEDFESYKGTIKNGNEVVLENAFIVYIKDNDNFVSYFRKDNDVTKPSSWYAINTLYVDRDNLSKEEISKLEKVIKEESLPYGTNLEGYYIDEESIVIDSPSNKKGRRK